MQVPNKEEQWLKDLGDRSLRGRGRRGPRSPPAEPNGVRGSRRGSALKCGSVGEMGDQPFV